MGVLKGLNLAGAKPKLPDPKIITDSKEFKSVLREEVHRTDAELAEGERILNMTPAGVTIKSATEENISSESAKLSRLVDDDFPFDESQLLAVNGMIQQQYACLIGAAGTGKTTLEQKLVDLLQDGLDEIDMSQYWKRGVPADDADDDYEIPEKLIPSILMCSFTGRSTQMTKKNFPKEWHGNIMTIHRALGFYPEFYQDLDPESNELVNKRRFVPSYTADMQMPWDIIIIDECGMLGLDLWHQLWAATKPGARIYMIGDINQLPPTHGKSILGFALSKWPTWELTHVHRQQGANNSIVDNAHRILKGLRPVSDSPQQLSILAPTSKADANEANQKMLESLTYMTRNHDWRFLTVDIDAEHKVAAIRIRQMLKLLHGKIYEPNRDFVVTPINGYEPTAPGFSLGQAPMNQELVVMLNQDSPRYIIDGGREKKNFAVGDKVMATINDYEAGITNGMTGIIISIAEHGGYIGDTRRFGLVHEVNEYFAGLVDEDDDDVEFSLDEMVADSAMGMDELKKKEQGERGPASHIVTVRFGEGDHAFEIAFGSKSEVASLMLAYVATCHKLQGGEAPLVFVICHQQNKRPLCREWLYTAVTRGSHRVVLLQTKQGVGFAVSKQTIKGANLKAKIASFAKLTEEGLIGAAVKVKLPHPRSLVTDVVTQTGSQIADEEAPQQREAPRNAEQEIPRQPTPSIKVGSLHIHIHASAERTAEPEKIPRESVIDIKAEPRTERSGQGNPLAGLLGQAPQPARLEHRPQARLVSQYGAYHTAVELGYVKLMANRLLTHQPVQETEDVRGVHNDDRVSQPDNPLLRLLRKSQPPKPAPAAPAAKPKSLAGLIAAQKGRTIK